MKLTREEVHDIVGRLRAAVLIIHDVRSEVEAATEVHLWKAQQALLLAINALLAKGEEEAA